MIQSISDNVKLTKLKAAKKLAVTKSQRKKILDSASEFNDSVDAQIQSVALNKFAVRKVQRLKSLGKTKDEIAQIITDVSASDPSIIDRATSALSGLGIDKKFVDLTADEILDKVNFIAKQPEPEDTKPLPKPKSSNGDVKNNATSSDKDDKKPLKIKINQDTATLSEVERNNEKIYDYLVANGELDIADYILDLMTTPTKNINTTSDMQGHLAENSEELKRLSLINTGIYDVLSDIRSEQLKQDTTISIQEKLAEQIAIPEFTQEKDKKGGTSFWDIIKTVGLGASVSYFAGLFDDDNFKKSMQFIADGDLGGLVKHLGGMDWLNGIVKTAALAVVIKAIGPISQSVKLLQSGLKSIYGLKDVIGKMAKTMPNIPQVDKYFKSFDEKVDVDKPKKVSEVEKPKTEKVTKTSKKGGSKLSTAKKIIPKASKVASKLAKFTKFVPFLGLAVASGTALYAANDAYDNADKVLGIPKGSITDTHRIAAAAGAALEDFLWPLSPDARDTAEIVLKAAAAMGFDVPKSDKNSSVPKFFTGSFSDMESRFKTGDYDYKRVDYELQTPKKSINDMSIDDLFTLNTKESSIEKLNPDVLYNLKNMAAEYMDLFGEKMQLNSGFRSFEEQEKLKKAKGSLAAAPGSSMHNYGFAFDMQTQHANKAIKAGLFDKYGFWRPVMPQETWHVEPKGIDRESIRIAGKREWVTKDTKLEDGMRSDESPENDVMDVPVKSVSDVDVSIPVDNYSVPSDKAAIRNELQELTRIKAQMINAMGAQKGKAEFIRRYGERESMLKQALNSQDTMNAPDIYKDKRINEVNDSETNMVNSTKQYSSNRAIQSSQGVSQALSINSKNDSKPEKVSVIDAFSDF